MSYKIINSIVSNINIFVSRFGNRVTGHKNRALIITTDLYRTEIVTKFNEDRTDPNTLVTTI